MASLARRTVAAVGAAATISMALYLIAAHQAAASTRGAPASHANAEHRARERRRVSERRRAHEPRRAHERRRAGKRRRAGHRRGQSGAIAGSYVGAGSRAIATAPAENSALTRGGSKHRAGVRAVVGKSWKLAFRGAHGAGARAHGDLATQAANDPADTISDFKFTPGNLTVHVGDTVTWTNDGPTNHTATANDGSFNTGTLKQGQSASHTFTKAGTFAYICAIHPFMKGTIVVEASSASVTTPSTTASTPSSGSDSGSGTGTASTPSATTSGTAAHRAASSASSDSTLPNTGLDLTASLLAGIGLIACGLVLRRRVP
jgi:plastocyanin